MNDDRIIATAGPQVLSVADVRTLRDLHQGEGRRVGSKLRVEMVCRECGQPAPCVTRTAAIKALQADL